MITTSLLDSNLVTAHDPVRVIGTTTTCLADADGCTFLKPSSISIRASRKRAPELFEPSTTATMRVPFLLAVTTM
jgi:hypothetical protein